MHGEVRADDIHVDDRAFSYLVMQKGSLDHLRNDRAAWLAAYRASLAADLASMEPYLPGTCRGILDVGSGLGGIDILLSRYYAGGPTIYLLDGAADPPVMERHARTFNDMGVAKQFLRDNGVEQRISFYSPDYAQNPRSLALVEPVDLVVSLGSWCFHYPPSTYLEFVKAATRPGTMLVVDVRKPEWFADLAQEFNHVDTVLTASKFSRQVFVRR